MLLVLFLQRLGLDWRNAHVCFLSLRCARSELMAGFTKAIIEINHFFANFNLFIPLFFHNLGWGFTAKPALPKSVPRHSPAGPGRQGLS